MGVVLHQKIAPVVVATGLIFFKNCEIHPKNCKTLNWNWKNLSRT